MNGAGITFEFYALKTVADFFSQVLYGLSYPGVEFLNSGFSIAGSVGEPRGDMTWEIAMIFSSTMEIMRGFRRLEQADRHILGKNRSGPCCLKHDRYGRNMKYGRMVIMVPRNMVVISLKLNASLNSTSNQRSTVNEAFSGDL